MKIMSKLYWLRTEKKDLEKRVNKLNNQIEEMTNLSSAPISDMPHSTEVGNPTEKYVVKITELKDMRDELLYDIINKEGETESYIKNISDPEIRLLMRMYYIDGFSWNDIARKLYKNNCDGSTPRKKVNQYLKER